MRILIIQPKPRAARQLTELMAGEGWPLRIAENGADGLQLAHLDEYDIVLLDAELPDLSSLDLIRRMRSAGVATPIIVLSGDNDVDRRIRAFAAGADDVVLRLVDPGELLARIAAISRRAHGHASSVINIGAISVDIDRQTVEANGRPLRLTGKEYALFELLAVRNGAVVSCGTILDHLYGGLDEPDTDVVSVFICRLRRKLTQAGVPAGVLQTVWGRGFSLRASPPPASRLTRAA